MKRPTISEVAVLRAIADHRAEHHGASPSYRAIAERMGRAVGTVALHVEKLERKGYLRRTTSGLEMVAGGAVFEVMARIIGDPIEPHFDEQPPGPETWAALVKAYMKEASGW